MLVYLGICAVLAFAATVAAAMGAAPPAPTFHIAFAVGAMPLVFGAIIHFIPVLTRGRLPPRAIHRLPLLVQAAGVLVPFGLSGALPSWTLHLAAVLVAVSASMLFFWITRSLRDAFGTPHPGARWYGAAILALFLAVSLVPVWLALPELRPALRLFHLHLNTLGFIGLAALGTVPVLLPTALGRMDSGAATRLFNELPWAAGGALIVSAGAAAQSAWLGGAGALGLAWVAARNLLAWQRNFGMRALCAAAPAISLWTATSGFLLLLAAGTMHAAGGLPARPALAAYAALFLMPLVTGALSQLLPVWRHPGPDTPERRAFHLALAPGARARAGLFFGGGVLLLADLSVGILLAAAGLGMFALVLVRALWLDRAQPGDDNPRPTS